jgi:hypothetical protein
MSPGERHTLKEMFEDLTVPQLKERIKLLTPRAPQRKADLVAFSCKLTIEKFPESLESLDELQRHALAEAAHAPGGRVDWSRFMAKYGSFPEFGGYGDGWGRDAPPTLLRLFLPGGDILPGGEVLPGGDTLPVELRELAMALLPAPNEVQLESRKELPETVEWVEERVFWEGKERKVTDELVTVPLTVTLRETAACRELGAVLRLIDAGKVGFTPSTGVPTAAGIRAVTEVLEGGDYFPIDPVPPLNAWEQHPGPIRAHVWPRLLAVGGLAELVGKSLRLKLRGRKALKEAPEKALLWILKRWVKVKGFEEFNRIDSIKGQRGKGRRGFVQARGRREVILGTLREAQAGSWVSLEDLSRFMQASGRRFSLHRDPWRLYISDAQYGSLGYDGFHGWNILEERYLRVVLFEILATLGMVDLAHIPPGEARSDFFHIRGTDELSFLSRYDGLFHFRITPLGKYLLELDTSYQPSSEAKAPSKARLSSEGGLVLREEEGLDEADRASLIGVAKEKRGGSGRWTLSLESVLQSVEQGRAVENLKENLSELVGGELPEEVAKFFEHAARRSVEVRDGGPVHLFRIATVPLAEELLEDPVLRKLVLRAGAKLFVVQEQDVAKFRKALWKLRRVVALEK